MDYSKQMDYSSLSTYLSCPRKFFFKYILCLQKDGVPSIDLIFGSCWHFGMECAYKMLKSSPRESTPTSLTEIATLGFQKMWDRDASEWFDPDATFPKSPNRARDMYYKYFDLFLSQDKSKRVLGIEEPFTLHVSDDLPDYIGRMDLVLEDNDSLEIHEHKTSKFNSPIIFTGYEASLQTEGYLTVGHIYYDSLPRIMYNQALCQKSKVDHTRYPITKNRHAIERFISDYRFYCLQIKANLKAFEHWISTCGDQSYEKTVIMPCFYRNAGYACTMYFRACEYLDLCQMRNNPMTFGEKTPQGFRVEEWNPGEHAAKNDELFSEVFGNGASDTSDQAGTDHSGG